jgi:dienelactone hydrolase
VDDATFATFLDFFQYDRAVPFDARIDSVAEADGLRTERLSFQSTTGVRVPARLATPSGLSVRGSPAVIFLHGGGPEGKDGPYNLRFSELAARAGFVVLSIDMLHFGERNTGLLETFSETEKHDRLYNQESAYLAWVVQTVKDVSRSYDYLVQERGVDPGRVGIMGFSRGAQSAVLGAGADRRLAALVMVYGGHFDGLEDGHLAPACPANYIVRVRPRPILMINGESDTDFRKEESVVPMQRLAGPAATFRWTLGGHGHFEEEDEAFLVQWLQEHLR